MTNLTLKLHLLFLVFIVPLLGHSQIQDSIKVKNIDKKNLLSKTKIIGFSLTYLSGASRGMEQTLVYHYSKFKKVFPKANDKYWDNSISWKNKYKNLDPLQGPKFPGSTTIFVNTTDAKHLFDSISKYALIGGTIVIVFHDKKTIKEYLKDGLISSIGYSLGFTTTYGFFNYYDKRN